MKVAPTLASQQRTSISRHGEMNISGDEAMAFETPVSLLRK
jgi:hypothetical protein